MEYIPARNAVLLIPRPGGLCSDRPLSVQLMCRWLMKTENATKCGAQCEVFSHGMLKARFTSDHRIKQLELVFDVMSFMQQLQRAMGGGGFRITPNTVRWLISFFHWQTELYVLEEDRQDTH